jgi:hypothetical protein
VPDEILALLGREVIAERTAYDEIKRHPIPGSDHIAALAELTVSGLLRVQEMRVEERVLFRELTANDLARGLDDGEAATIAFAIGHANRAAPVIDERKATNLFANRWPDRTILMTVDLLADPRVVKHLSRSRLCDAVYSALTHARMRVASRSREWVNDLLGEERVRECRSLGRQDA